MSDATSGGELRVAVIGCGHLGRIHARLISQVPGTRLVGVVDPVQAARHAVSEEFGVPAFATHADLADQIDAAVLASPTSLHHELGLDLLNRGVHLLVEKPITATVAQADELIAAARQNNLVLQVGHVERFNPALTAAALHLGRPRYIEAVRASGYTFRSTDVGVVLDLMIHDIDVVLSLVGGPVAEVESLGFSVFGHNEDLAQARLHFANGCVANLSASRCSFQPQRVMQVFGDGAYAAIDFATRSARVVRPHPALVRRELDVDALPSQQKAHLRDHLFEELLPVRQLQPAERNAILDEQSDFVASIREGRAPRVTGQHGRDALEVAFRILDGIGTHRWDAAATGPVGPLGLPGQPILRGPHFTGQDQPAERRRAG